MNKCNRCDDELPLDGDFVTCSGCNGGLHFECSGLRESTYRGMSSSKKQSWRCITCRSLSSSSSQMQRSNSLDSGEHTFVGSNLQEMQSFMKQINKKLDTLVEVKNSVEDLKMQINDLTKEVQKYKNKTLQLEKQLRERETRIETLENRMMDMENYSRRKNIEIVGLKKQNNENLMETFSKICKKIEVEDKINAKDIDIIHRIPNRKDDKYQTVIIKFNNHNTRNIILEKRRMKINNNDIYGDGDTREVYINENQSKEFKSMFWEIKKEALRQGYAYIWSRNGKIYIRKSQNGKKILVRKLSDIQEGGVEDEAFSIFTH